MRTIIIEDRKARSAAIIKAIGQFEGRGVHYVAFRGGIHCVVSGKRTSRPYFFGYSAFGRTIL